VKTSNSEFGSFDGFRENFSYFESGKEIEELENIQITFDSKMLELEDSYNIERINEELNTISRKIFRFGMVLESQTQILQLAEDAFERWHAEKYMEISKDKEYKTNAKGETLEKPVERTERQKDYIIMTRFQDEYTELKSKVYAEKHKHRLIKRAVSSLEGYSYKLHSLQDYRKAALQKGIS